MRETTIGKPRLLAAGCRLAGLGALWWLGVACERAERVEPRWGVTPEPEIEIGKVDGADPYLFESIRYARLLPDGRVVAADAGEPVIRVYGPGGEFLTEIGGRGDGPAEFRAINGMWLTSEGRIGAWDATRRRITTFGLDGELRSTHRVVVGSEIPAGNLEVFLGAFGDDDVLLASLAFGDRGNASLDEPIADRWALARFGQDGELRGFLGEVRGMRRVRGQPLPFSPMAYAVVLRDSIYASDGYEAEIAVLDGSGARGRTIELPSAPASPDEAWSALEAELRRRDHALYLQHLESLPRTDEIPQVAGLLADDQGYIWAKVYDPSVDSIWLHDAVRPAPGGEWRVLRPDGELVATVPMPENVTPLDIRGDRLLGVARDELDVERIVVHGLER